VEISLPLISDAEPRHEFIWLSVLVTMGAAVARIVAQPKMRGDRG
jgi:hypothetical protein